MINSVCAIFLVLVLTACTKTRQPQGINGQSINQANSVQQAGMGWYAVRMKIHWEKERPPRWYFGTLIAGEVISPLLKQYQQNIIYWRLHRRAVRDQAGHAFSFIFYSSQADAAKIYQVFQKSKPLATLLEQKHLDKVSYDPLQARLTATIAETSDPHWPDKIRHSWPFFMMGASRMWLEQVRSFQQESSDKVDMIPRYKVIQNGITELWQEQGEHALMHQLNGLYAYQPVLMRF